MASRQQAESGSLSIRKSSNVEDNLPFSPPYDWAGILTFFRGHSIPYVESVDEHGYERVVHTKQGLGWLRVDSGEKPNVLRLRLWNGDDEDLARISLIVRAMFDLDAVPAQIEGAFHKAPHLSSIWSRHPGLRVARLWSGSEAIFTTILGQLVSVRFARTLVRELMEAAGARVSHPKTGEVIHLFPSPEEIFRADLTKIRSSEARRLAILSIANMLSDVAVYQDKSLSPKELRKRLMSVPGVGAWTAEYVAMRGFSDDDAFPSTDYVLRQELKLHPELRVEQVRPYRAYAAVALWRGFADRKEGTL
jgi:DNA-3-methyladenine glycosylase II